MFRNYKKGFTLIELLVVIAIIGILSSVVLASLNTARNKGADAAIKSNVNNARAQAELRYDSVGQSYVDVCTGVAGTPAGSAAGIGQFITGAGSAGSAVVDCQDTAAGWALEAQLKSDATRYYCVDSTGFAGELAASGVTAADDIRCQ
jgi:prepilin-type N-terminal cleavage/methylation domain-containing protein